MIPVSEFYVLYTAPAVWVLCGQPTLATARRSVDWQRVGQGERDQLAVCRFDAESKQFVCVDSGVRYEFPLSRGAFTEEAYSRFMVAHGVDPKLMTE